MRRTTRWSIPVGAVGVFLVGMLGVTSATAAGAPAASRRSPNQGTFLPAPLPTVRSPLDGGKKTSGPVKLSGSLNWAGYAQSAQTHIFTSVTDTWRVPTVATSTHALQVSSDWVGIGGFKDTTLVQAGTLADNDSGSPVYQAWTEILPASEVPLSMTVSAGDSITTTIRETSSNTWLMQVADNTTHVTQARTVSYASSGRSVEAIHERSTICSPRCALGSLATTTNVTFDPGSFTSTLQPTPQPLLVAAAQREKTTKRGIKVKPAKVYQLVMVSEKPTTVLATPSAADADHDGFSVADGGSAPSPPSS